MSIELTMLFLCILGLNGSALYLYFRHKKSQHCLNQIINFSSYYAVLEYHLSRAYEIIYKDRVLIYSLEAVKLDGPEFIAATKAFGNLVLRMIGPNLKHEFMELYGNEDTFLFIITEYFNQKYEEDEIRKGSIEEMQNKEVDDADK